MNRYCVDLWRAPECHQLHVHATPTAIHDALTTAAGLRGWWAKDSDIGAGSPAEHELRFVKGDRRVTMRFRVDHADASRVQWTCIANDNPIWIGSTLVWSTEPSDDGATLRFEHSGFADGPPPAHAMTVEGRQHFVASLRDYLHDGVGRPW